MELREFTNFKNNAIFEEKKSANIIGHLTFNWIKTDFVNANRRVYPTTLIEKATREFSAELKRGSKPLGMSGHGQMGAVVLDHVSHAITEVSFSPVTKIGSCKADLLNTSSGKNLKVLLQENISGLGASLRAHGNVAQKTFEGQLVDEVQAEGFKLISLDLVSNPSFGELTKPQLFEELAQFVPVSKNEVEGLLLEYFASDAYRHMLFKDYLRLTKRRR